MLAWRNTLRPNTGRPGIESNSGIRTEGITRGAIQRERRVPAGSEGPVPESEQRQRPQHVTPRLGNGVRLEILVQQRGRVAGGLQLGADLALREAGLADTLSHQLRESHILLEALLDVCRGWLLTGQAARLDGQCQDPKRGNDAPARRNRLAGGAAKALPVKLATTMA